MFMCGLWLYHERMAIGSLLSWYRGWWMLQFYGVGYDYTMYHEHIQVITWCHGWWSWMLLFYGGLCMSHCLAPCMANECYNIGICKHETWYYSTMHTLNGFWTGLRTCLSYRSITCLYGTLWRLTEVSEKIHVIKSNYHNAHWFYCNSFVRLCFWHFLTLLWWINNQLQGLSA